MALLDIPVVDCHHHCWTLDDNPHYPWLANGAGSLPRVYDVLDYLADMRTVRLAGSIHVEAGWNRSDPLGETAWLARRIAATATPSAAIVYVDLTADDAAARLERQASFGFARGVRMRLADDHRSLFALRPGENPMVDPRWLSGFSRLSSHGLSFEVQITPRLMADAAALADRFPETTIVLSHLGFPMERRTQSHALWRNGLRSLAERPNVRIKLSGFAMIDPALDSSYLSGLVRYAVECFGPSRAMFGTNFPVDASGPTAAPYLARVLDLFRAYSDDERQLIMAGTAARTYGLS